VAPPQSLPQHHPSPRELDDLELLVAGAYAPIRGFNEPGSPVTLELPPELEDAGEVELVDPEGLPLAVVRRGEHRWPVHPLTHAQHGPFRRLHLTPAQVRRQHAGRAVVPVSGPLTVAQVQDLAERGPLLLLALTGTGTPELSPVALVRATLAAAAMLPDAVVVAAPLPSHGSPAADHALGVAVAENFAEHDGVLALVDDDGPLPDPVAAIVDEDRPDPGEQGLVLFFTGLSGSGKSTLARALLDRLLEHGGRSVTSLDGDVVRRNLSAGLGFSREDRETNIRRIGWVAAEISRHGGVALCSPIAPFDQTRQQVREMTYAAGGDFFLVHVATPVEVCEQRDRKGLYARARRGEIPDFTGISSPYEEPEDADVRVDTTGRSIEECLEEVVEALAMTGHLDLRETVPGEQPAVDGDTVEAPAEDAAADAAAEPLRVLFVCTANVSRSPTMELLARRRLDGDPSVEVSSRGVRALRGAGLDPGMLEVLGDVEDDGRTAHQIRPADVAAADVVLTAEAQHRSYLLQEYPGAARKVFSLGQFADLVQQGDLALSGRELVQELGRRRPRADARLDVADPYRRGRKAARAALDHIEQLLDVVLPALVGRR
jgi:sulfate adenylyltransferase